jgi:hypothetical protein
MTFEDDLTRELPSAVRTFTDLEPFRPAPALAPPCSSVELADEDVLDDLDLAGRTLQLPPVSRPLSIPAFSHDIVAHHDASAALAFLREHVAVVVGLALLACSVTTGTLGVAVGRATATSGRTSDVSVVVPRAPRTSVILAAHEAITEPPRTAPAKLAVLLPAPRVLRPASAPPPAPALAPAPARRPGFQRPADLDRAAHR